MRRLLPSLTAFALAAVAYLGGALAPVEHALMDWRSQVDQRDATGDVVVIGIDAKSLAELNTWPWPRRYHAQLVDRLVAADADRILLDIDFSSKSTPANDNALADAIKRSGGRVILPVFQQANAAPTEQQDLYRAQPIEALRRHATLGSVNVRPEHNGLVRRASTYTIIGNKVVAGAPGLLFGENDYAHEAFYLDYGIRAETIPLMSYADVLAGRFDPAMIAGKRIIVGAAAVELGDRFAVPVYRSMFGPVLQAMAFEAIAQDRAMQRITPAVPLVLALVLALLSAHAATRWSWRARLICVTTLSVAVIAASLAIHMRWPLSIDVSPILLTIVLSFLFGVFAQVERQARIIVRQTLEMLHKHAMLKGVVQDSFDGIAITDEHGIIEQFNDAAAAMLGIDPKDVIGHSIENYFELPFEIRSSDNDDGGENSKRLSSSLSPIELPLRTPDGRELHVELVMSSSVYQTATFGRASKGHTRRVLIFTFRDITDRLQVQEAQKKAMEEAVSANRAKSEFLTNMSHELRTPLNAIIGFSEMLKGEMFGPVGDPRYVEYSKDIYHSGSHLLSLVNDILDVSKIEAGKMEPGDDPVDVGSLSESCLRIVRQRAEEKNIDLSAELPPGLPTLQADERMIKQSIMNLLSNAVKFTDAGGSVLLKLNVDGTGNLEIAVTDTGIGIPAEHIDSLATPFYQVDGSLQRNYEGTGLGLYLVSRFIELHGGSLAINSTPNVGTTVTIRFPHFRLLSDDTSFTEMAEAS